MALLGSIVHCLKSMYKVKVNLLVTSKVTWINTLNKKTCGKTYLTFILNVEHSSSESDPKAVVFNC